MIVGSPIPLIEPCTDRKCPKDRRGPPVSLHRVTRRMFGWPLRSCNGHRVVAQSLSVCLSVLCYRGDMETRRPRTPLAERPPCNYTCFALRNAEFLGVSIPSCSIKRCGNIPATTIPHFNFPVTFSHGALNDFINFCFYFSFRFYCKCFRTHFFDNTITIRAIR